MVITKPDERANKIKLAHAFFKSNSTTKECYDTVVKENFEIFEFKCKIEYFKESNDVCLFKHNGADKQGLRKWITL